MGSSYDVAVIEAPNVATLREKFRQLCDERAYCYGHGGYTGTFAEKGGDLIVDESRVFATPEEAEAYVDVECDDDKWGPARAVKLQEGDFWYVGGWCSS